MALLIILLLLILLVPRACQALLGPGQESSGPTAPEKTSVTEESTTAITEETVQQGSTVGGGETEVEASIAETASGAGAGEEESIETLDTEAAADLARMAGSFEAPIAESAIADTNINQAAPRSCRSQASRSCCRRRQSVPLARCRVRTPEGIPREAG